MGLFPFLVYSCHFLRKKGTVSNLCRTPTMPSWEGKYGWPGPGGLFQNMRKTPREVRVFARRSSPAPPAPSSRQAVAGSPHRSRPLTRAQTVRHSPHIKIKRTVPLQVNLRDTVLSPAPTRKPSSLGFLVSNGRRDTYSKKKGMALSKLSHAFLFVVVVAARCFVSSSCRRIFRSMLWDGRSRGICRVLRRLHRHNRSCGTSRGWEPSP